MADANQEFLRLKEAERSTHDRFKRLSGNAGIYGHPEVVKAAKRLWTEAVAAVLAYRGR